MYKRQALRSSIPVYTLDEVFAKKDDIAKERGTISRAYFEEVSRSLLSLPKVLEEVLHLDEQPAVTPDTPSDTPVPMEPTVPAEPAASPDLPVEPEIPAEP